MGKGQHLAEFELLLLLAAMRLAGEAYGAALRREIEERTGRPVSIGAVYATLARLEEKGLVTFTVSDPEPVPGGRSRKHVHLTPEGDASVRQSMAVLGHMTEGLSLGWEPTGS